MCESLLSPKFSCIFIELSMAFSPLQGSWRLLISLVFKAPEINLVEEGKNQGT